MVSPILTGTYIVLPFVVLYVVGFIYFIVKGNSYDDEQ